MRINTTILSYLKLIFGGELMKESIMYYYLAIILWTCFISAVTIDKFYAILGIAHIFTCMLYEFLITSNDF